MSRAMGSSCTCWGAVLWCSGCVMLVLGVCAAAGAGPCACTRGSARFGVVVVCVARWWLSGPAVSPLGAVRVAAGGWR